MKPLKWIYNLAYIDHVVCFTCDNVNIVLMDYWSFFFGIVVSEMIFFILEVGVSDV
jgi:hypothetical protein